MQAYRGYYEGGRIVPMGSPKIPEGSELIITVLEPAEKSRVKRQREAFEKFMDAMKNSPPLSSEFDEIISRRVNIEREVEL